jgi:hypothetical protein
MIAHDVLTYRCARAVGFPDRQVVRTPWTYDSLDPGPYNPSCPPEFREGESPAVRSKVPAYDETVYYAPFVPYRKPEGDRVSALQVLSLYSAEPDWGMDAELRLSPLQILTGGSQGYRHLRYGLFMFRAGKAHLRARHFSRLAQEAARRPDPYWALRYSARALHYLQDLASPFHTKPFPERLVLRGLARPAQLYNAVFNYHLNIERCQGYLLWQGSPVLLGSIDQAEPVELRSVSRFTRAAVRGARPLAGPLFNRCARLFDDRMLRGEVKLGTGQIEEVARDPEIRRLLCAWMAHAASLVKGYLNCFVLPLAAAESCESEELS